MIPKIMAHGGAWDWDDTLDAPKCVALKAAIAVGYDILQREGSALDAVEQTVVALENNPLFDAGRGGYLNQDGLVQLDALIVDGAQHDFGAVGGVTRVQNPIKVARQVMEKTDFCFFVGAGADRMAEKLGLPLIPNAHLITAAMHDYYLTQQRDGSSDTVGAIAIDRNGNTAAATSTSGTPYKPAGRVGDSPLYGAGGYAENGIGTAGATGKGENIMRVLLAKYTCDKLAEGLTVHKAADTAMQYVEQFFNNSMSGIIVLDSQGNPGAAHTTPKLAFAWVDNKGQIQTAMKADKIR